MTISTNTNEVSFAFNSDQLDTIVALLSEYKAEDYYAYERKQVWYVGLGNYTSLLVDRKGETAIVTLANGEKKSFPVNESIPDVARRFMASYAQPGAKVFGNIGFNYAACTRGQPFNVGKWPLLSLMIPRATVELRTDRAIVSGVDSEIIIDVVQKVKKASAAIVAPARPALAIDTTIYGDEYEDRVSRALSDITRGEYVKVIPSRSVEISRRIDMVETLRQGRLHNSPARTFCLKHAGFEATGFSPELVALIENGKVITEPLAGTRARVGTAEEIEKLRQELLGDPKEIVEHVLSVKEAIDELKRFCSTDTVVVEDLMSVRPRGPVQHLGSRVAGRLSPGKDVWDAFGVLFPSITAAGIPKAPALQAIQHLESTPRELYSGAVLMLEGAIGRTNSELEDKSFFEAALVLRTVFQEADGRRWLQAGAGVIAQSNPQRELIETREKLASVAPYVIAAEDGV